MKRVLDIALASFFAAYPLLMYAGLARYSPRAMAMVVLSILMLRLLLLVRISPSQWRGFIPLFIAGVTCAAVSFVLRSETALRFIPVTVSGVLLATFGYTLWHEPTMIARFAALQEKNMTPEIVAYCRKVTWVWCAFFLANGSISTATVFHPSREYWTVYNGLISYVLMGSLFGIELFVRGRMKRRNAERLNR